MPKIFNVNGGCKPELHCMAREGGQGMMKKLVKNGRIFTESEDYLADLLIEDEKIVSIGARLHDADAEIIDAAGCYVLPGAVDVHTHMDLDVGISRAVDDFYDGTMAADGIPSVKAYLTYGFKLNDADVLQILQKMKEIGGITAFHCENHDIVEYLKQKHKSEGKTSAVWHAKSRPNLAEAEAVQRVLKLARMAGDAPVYIVHLSCKESLEAVREARRQGQKQIFVETCPQYLLLTEECYTREDGLKYIMSPPLRTKEDCDALWKGLAKGEIQAVATDHCPFHYAKEKQMGKDDFTACPNGAPGVEERLILLYSEGVAKGRLTMHRLVETLCTSPSRIYGLYPQKGALLPGADADLVILNPDASGVLIHSQMHGAVDYTAYEGMKIQGEIRLVMQRGNVIAKDGRFTGEKGAGRFIHRTPHTNV